MSYAKLSFDQLGTTRDFGPTPNAGWIPGNLSKTQSQLTITSHLIEEEIVIIC